MIELLNDTYTIRFDKVDLLRDGGCISYIAQSKQKKYILKLFKPAFMETAKQSIDILLYLQNYNFPAPTIVLTSDYTPFITYGDNLVVLFDFIEGKEPELGEMMEQTGDLVGLLHHIMQGYNKPLIIRDKEFFIDRYIEQLKRKEYPKDKIAWFKEYGDLLWERIKDLPRGYCHGDLHRGNILLSQSNKLYLLDFDTSCDAFPVFDIMVMCDSTDYFNFNSEGYDNSTYNYDKFLKGYERYRTLNNNEYESFYDLIAVRHYQLQATIMEIYGPDCVNEEFIDRQLGWLESWRELCERRS